MRGNHDLTILTLANELAALKRKYARQSSQLSYFRTCERKQRIEHELNEILIEELRKVAGMHPFDFENMIEKMDTLARENAREKHQHRATRKAIRRSKHKRSSKPRTKKHVAIETTVSA